MGIDFYVDENVLIPRDDTEVLVKEVVFYCEESNEAIYKT
jgi:methylase of polypeptide subunit release factors